MATSELTASNQREFIKLLLSIRASVRRFSLLLVVCDDEVLQKQLVTDYERALQTQQIVAVQARLDTQRPSLRATLEELVALDPVFGSEQAVVVTLLNANELMRLQFSGEKSGQEQFFFSLQWTREALRRFKFPVVLWLSDRIATQLAQQAPDFWSWRSGVFEFESQATATAAFVDTSERQERTEVLVAGSSVAIEDLQEQIAALEASAPTSPLLLTLYQKLGDAFSDRYESKQALAAYEKAVAVAGEDRDRAVLAVVLRRKGDLLFGLSRYEEAIAAFITSIKIFDELLDQAPDNIEVLNSKGNSLQSLADLQAMLSEHGAARASYGESIAAYDAALERAPDYVSALNNKGLSLKSLADLQAMLSEHSAARTSYGESIAAYDAALERAPDLVQALNNKGNSLSKLAALQAMLSEYSAARTSYGESIAAYDAALERAPDYVSALNNKGLSLQSLASLLMQQEELKSAIDCFGMALSLWGRSLQIAPGNTQLQQRRDQLVSDLESLSDNT